MNSRTTSAVCALLLLLLQSESNHPLAMTTEHHHPAAGGSSSSRRSPRIIPWLVRPATPHDGVAATRVLTASYSELLRPDYDEELLSRAVPYMSTPRESLLNCGTWFVVEHPETGEITGCGGWTAEAPKVKNQLDPTTTTAAAVGKLVPHLRHFACHPAWTRRGVARAIWDRTWKEIIEQLGPETTLQVYSTLSAVPFYASLGFVPQTNLNIPLDGKDLLFPATLMRREVNS
mmetsp:Transcript_4237/g.8873  ORF Transcript_4237/g.8873 Transcript_4237/m.8873 type:complete len:232 (-) Transcript_4237:139-834(-)